MQNIFLRRLFFTLLVGSLAVGCQNSNPEIIPAQVVLTTGSPAYAVLLSAKGDLVLTLNEDYTLNLWNATTGKHLTLMQHPELVAFAVFSPDSTRILSVSYDERARIWETSTGNLLAIFTEGDFNFVYPHSRSSAAFTQSGKRVFTQNPYGSGQLWDINGTALESFGAGGKLSSDGIHLIVRRDSISPVEIWNAETSQKIGELQDTESVVPDKVVDAIFSNDQSHVMLKGSFDIRNDSTTAPGIWEVQTGKLVSILDNHSGGFVYPVAFSPNGIFAITKFYKKDNSPPSADVWNVASGQKLATIHTGYGWTFSPDSESILAEGASPGVPETFTTFTGQSLSTFSSAKYSPALAAAQFSPSGQQILTISSNAEGIEVWDRRGQLLYTLDAPTKHMYGFSIDRVGQFSADGTKVVAVCLDGNVRVWNLPQ